MVGRMVGRMVGPIKAPFTEKSENCVCGSSWADLSWVMLHLVTRYAKLVCALRDHAMAFFCGKNA